MKLIVTTPSGIAVEAAGVRHVRAEDGTGAFGLLPHHGDFLTVLSISVVTWRDEENREHHVAVRGGLLTMTGGGLVQIATRDAEQGDDLDALEKAVVERYRADADADAAAASQAARLETEIVRRVLRYLRPALAIPTFREGVEP